MTMGHVQCQCDGGSEKHRAATERTHARTCLISLTVAVLLTPNNLYKSCSAAAAPMTKRPHQAIMTNMMILCRLVVVVVVVLEHQSWARRGLMPQVVPLCRLLDIMSAYDSHLLEGSWYRTTTSVCPWSFSSSRFFLFLAKLFTEKIAIFQ